MFSFGRWLFVLIGGKVVSIVVAMRLLLASTNGMRRICRGDVDDSGIIMTGLGPLRSLLP